jgi:hypothetical protein
VWDTLRTYATTNSGDFIMYAINTINSARVARFGSGGAILRSKNGPLTDDQIIAAAPSVFAEDKHSSRSEKYTYIPTSEVLKGLRNEGFMPYEVRQGGSRDEEKRGFTKHMLRLRREGQVQVGDSLREIILLNAHDGTSSYRLMSGLFRLVCSNGLVIADGQAQELRIPHKGDIVSQVIEGAYRVIDEGQAIDAAVDGMRLLSLSREEQVAFAEAASELRFEEGKAPVDGAQLNGARREADRGNDLWRTFNRVQENLTRGGIAYTATNAQGQRSHRHTRPVNSIDGNVNLNRALWALTAKMQELKAA